MRKLEFLAALRTRLAGIPLEDLERSIEYYSESIDDRMEDGLSEEEAVAAMGSIDDIVSQIPHDAPSAQPEPAPTPPKKPRNAWHVWRTVLLIVGAPLWLSLLIAVLCLALGVCIALWSIIVALYATVFALAVSALACVAVAIILLVLGYNPYSLLPFGAGLLCAGITILLFLLFTQMAKGLAWMNKQMWLGIRSCFSRKERCQ